MVRWKTSLASASDQNFTTRLQTNRHFKNLIKTPVCNKTRNWRQSTDWSLVFFSLIANLEIRVNKPWFPKLHQESFNNVFKTKSIV